MQAEVTYLTASHESKGDSAIRMHVACFQARKTRLTCGRSAQKRVRR